jgi:hypothetical protein
MQVSRSSREVIFILTQPENERYATLKDLETLKKLLPTSKDIYKRTVNDFYATRPSKFENVCLAVFVSHYDFVSKKRYDLKFNISCDSDSERESDRDSDGFDDLNLDDEPSDCAVDARSNYFALPNDIGYLREREYPKVIRYVRYDKKKERTNYYREQLMLYKPWRKLALELENGIINHFEVFEQNKDTIVENRMIFEKGFSEIDEETYLKEMDSEIQEYYEHLFHEDADTMNTADDKLMANHNLRIELDSDAEIEDEEELIDMHGNHVPMNDNDYRLISTGLSSISAGKASKRLSDDEYKKLMIELNAEQQQYLMNLLSCIKDQSIFYHFVTGSAGTGMLRSLQCFKCLSFKTNLFY